MNRTNESANYSLSSTTQVQPLIGYILAEMSNMTLTKGVDDSQYGPFNISESFPLLNITFTQLFIQTNGYAMLKSETKEMIFMRVFASDVDIRHRGEIFHGRISSIESIKLISSYVDNFCNSSSQFV